MSNVIMLPGRAAKAAPDAPDGPRQAERQLILGVRDGLLELSTRLTGLRLTLMKLHQRLLEEKRD